MVETHTTIVIDGRFDSKVEAKRLTDEIEDSVQEFVDEVGFDSYDYSVEISAVGESGHIEKTEVVVSDGGD